MSTGGIRNSEHPDIILFPINTLSRLAEQCALRCRADLSDTRLRTCMCCLLLCWVPALCKHGVRKHWFFKVSALRWVGACCCLFSCGFRVLPYFVSSSVSCLLCGGGLLGLGEGHQACKSTEISHTSWRIFNLLFCIQCIDIVWGHHHLSPG